MAKEKKQLGTQYTRALFDIQTINEEKRTIDVVFATETPVMRRNWDGLYNEILDCNPKSVRMDRLNAGAPVLDSHSRWSVTTQLGVVENAVFKNKEGRATLRFSKRDDVEKVWGDVKDGILRGISVGYNVWAYDITEKQDNSVPEYRAVDWEPMEISLTPVPADVNSGTRSQDTLHEVTINSNINKNTMAEKLTAEERITQITSAVRAAGFDDAYATELVDNEALDVDQARAAIITKLGEAKPPKPAEQNKPTVPAAPVNDVQERATEILYAVRAANFDLQYAMELIEDKNMTADQARQAILTKMANAQPKPQSSASNVAITGADETVKTRSAIITGISLRSGLVQEKDVTPELIDGSRQYRSLSLLDIAEESLTRAGINYKGMSKMEIVGRAITSSTSDFPILLQGVIHKVLLNNYQAVSDSWRKWCMVGSVSDFRTHNRLRMGSFGRLDKLKEDGEYKTKSIPDAEQQGITADTFGNIINVSRKMIINDDLNAFSRLAQMLGRAAARSIEIDVYALLASNPTMSDGIALFHASHGNLIGTGVVPSAIAFDAMRVAMATQKDPSNNDFLDLRPSNLLIGLANGGTAKVINDALYDPDTANKLQKPNLAKGIFNNIIDTPRITGTEYYAFADPMEEPTIEVAFLDGIQDPFMEQHQEFSQDGASWKVRLDYGVGAIGWRGAVKNPGA